MRTVVLNIGRFRGACVISALLALLLCSCSQSIYRIGVVEQKRKVSEYANDSFRYELFQLPSGKQTTNLSLRIVNIKTGESPLRFVAADIRQYTAYYEYLLNQGPADFRMIYQGQELLPVSYSVENNYNAFPFETLNISFKADRKAGSKKPKVLLFEDKVFSHRVIWMKMVNNIK